MEARVLEGQPYNEQTVGDKTVVNRTYEEDDVRSMTTELADVRHRLTQVKTVISNANFNSGIQHHIIERGELKAQLDFWKKMRGAASAGERRYYRQPEGSVAKTTIPITEIDTTTDEIVRKIRSEDSMINRLNDVTQVDVPD